MVQTGAVTHITDCCLVRVFEPGFNNLSQFIAARTLDLNLITYALITLVQILFLITVINSLLVMMYFVMFMLHMKLIYIAFCCQLVHSV